MGEPRIGESPRASIDKKREKDFEDTIQKRIWAKIMAEEAPEPLFNYLEQEQAMSPGELENIAEVLELSASLVNQIDGSARVVEWLKALVTEITGLQENSSEFNQSLKAEFDQYLTIAKRSYVDHRLIKKLEIHPNRAVEAVIGALRHQYVTPRDGDDGKED